MDEYISVEIVRTSLSKAVTEKLLPAVTDIKWDHKLTAWFCIYFDVDSETSESVIKKSASRDHVEVSLFDCNAYGS